MPTGYTAGILEGKTKTFPEFAKLCMRAFGAAIHLRDNDLYDKYEPRTPSEYYKETLEEKKAGLEKINKMSDKELISNYKKESEREIKRDEKTIAKNKKDGLILKSFLEQAKKYKPPTSEHEGIKKFMIEQLQSTIKGDCNTEYYETLVEETKKKLKNLDAKKIRKELVSGIIKSISYYTIEYKEELKRCNESNKWAETFLNSLPKK